MQYYEALGLAPKLSLDQDDLKKRFYEQSRLWHPDRFSRAGAAEQQRALEMTAMINDAFRALRDPFKRAEYFFSQCKVELPKEVPPETLEEFFELNMALQELKAGDESVRPDIIEAHKRLLDNQDDSARQIEALFERYDGLDEAGRTLAKLEEPIGGLLNRRRYISNFLREAEKELARETP
jgi:molecular chaperone HscB